MDTNTYYEMNPDIPGEVMFVEEFPPETVVKTHHGFESEVRTIDNGDTLTYFHGKVNLTDGSYSKDLTNNTPIEVDGISYPLDGNHEVILPKPIPEEEIEFSSKEIKEILSFMQGLKTGVGFTS